MSFNWHAASTMLKDFGGKQISLTVPKTGMAFFDALRLYGAIDLYVGLREDVFIHDAGAAWEVNGKARSSRLAGRDVKALRQVLAGWKRKNPKPDAYCPLVRESLEQGKALPPEKPGPATKAFKGLDAALQSGVRHIAAADYNTLQGGQTSESTCCVAEIPLADGLLGFAGKKRVHAGVGDFLFLPIFEGQIDLSRVVSPLRAWVRTPNVTCAQALALLALRTSLFAEGYQDRLTAVAFNTAFHGQRSDNYSGVVAIASTAVGQVKSAALAGDLYQVLRALAGLAWTRRGATDLVPDALAMAHWLLHPLPKHLSSFITSQERLRRARKAQIFRKPDHVKEVFTMTFGSWQGDHTAARKFAKAVASGIYFSRMADKEPDQRQKAWYDEVTMLRSSPSAKAFIERAMILIEQGHREHSQVGTIHRDEAFDPSALFSSLGKDRSSFEEFRDLFRMYLVQESTYQVKEEAGESAGDTETPAESADEDEKEEAE